MPGQSGKSAFSFLGAVRDAAKKPVDYTEKGFTELPGGVEGVAELVEAKLSAYKTGANQGKKFIRLAGAVRTPETAIDKKDVWDKASGRIVTLGEPKVVTIRGRQTSIMLPLCNTKTKDAGANIDNAINEIKKLAGPEFVAPLASAPSEAAAWQTLEGLIKTLNSTPVQFKFRTRWKNPTADYPEGGVWDHEWLGAVTAEHAQSNGSAVADETGDGGEFNEIDNDSLQGEATAAGDDWDSLVAEWEGMEDGDEKDAVCERILDLAVAAGVDRDAAAATADWEECKALMDAASGEGAEPAEEPEEEPFEPVKGGVYGYEVEVLKDPKNPKKGKVKKRIEVVVKSVNKTKATVTADDNATKKPINGADKKPLPIPFDALIVE